MQCKKKEFIIEEKGYYIQHGYDTDYFYQKQKLFKKTDESIQDTMYYIYYIYQKFLKRQIVY